MFNALKFILENSGPLGDVKPTVVFPKATDRNNIEEGNDDDKICYYLYGNTSSFFIDWSLLLVID